MVVSKKNKDVHSNPEKKHSISAISKRNNSANFRNLEVKNKDEAEDRLDSGRSEELGRVQTGYNRDVNSVMEDRHSPLPESHITSPVIITKDYDSLTMGRENPLTQTEMHIQKMPFIEDEGRQFVVWTDVKEILFPSCSDSHCDIVLIILKEILKYPEQETQASPCTPKQQMAFLRNFRIVPCGTLLVNKVAIQENIQTLKTMVRTRHITSEEIHGKECHYAKEHASHTLLLSPDRNSTTELQGMKSSANNKFCWCVLPWSQAKDRLKGDSDSIIYKGLHLIPAIKLGSRPFVPMTLVYPYFSQFYNYLFDLSREHLIGSASDATKCLSLLEANCVSSYIARQQGWGARWNHITSRDLMIDWQKLCKHVKNPPAMAAESPDLSNNVAMVTPLQILFDTENENPQYCLTNDAYYRSDQSCVPGHNSGHLQPAATKERSSPDITKYQHFIPIQPKPVDRNMQISFPTCTGTPTNLNSHPSTPNTAYFIKQIRSPRVSTWGNKSDNMNKQPGSLTSGKQNQLMSPQLLIDNLKHTIPAIKANVTEQNTCRPQHMTLLHNKDGPVQIVCNPSQKSSFKTSVTACDNNGNKILLNPVETPQIPVLQQTSTGNINNIPRTPSAKTSQQGIPRYQGTVIGYDRFGKKILLLTPSINVSTDVNKSCVNIESSKLTPSTQTIDNQQSVPDLMAESKSNDTIMPTQQQDHYDEAINNTVKQEVPKNSREKMESLKGLRFTDVPRSSDDGEKLEDTIVADQKKSQRVDQKDLAKTNKKQQSDSEKLGQQIDCMKNACNLKQNSEDNGQSAQHLLEDEGNYRQLQKTGMIGQNQPGTKTKKKSKPHLAAESRKVINKPKKQLSDENVRQDIKQKTQTFTNKKSHSQTAICDIPRNVRQTATHPHLDINSRTEQLPVLTSTRNPQDENKDENGNVTQCSVVTETKNQKRFSNLEGSSSQNKIKAPHLETSNGSDSSVRNDKSDCWITKQPVNNIKTKHEKQVEKSDPVRQNYLEKDQFCNKQVKNTNRRPVVLPTKKTSIQSLKVNDRSKVASRIVQSNVVDVVGSIIEGSASSQRRLEQLTGGTALHKPDAVSRDAPYREILFDNEHKVLGNSLMKLVSSSPFAPDSQHTWKLLNLYDKNSMSNFTRKPSRSKSSSRHHDAKFEQTPSGEQIHLPLITKSCHILPSQQRKSQGTENAMKSVSSPVLASEKAKYKVKCQDLKLTFYKIKNGNENRNKKQNHQDYNKIKESQKEEADITVTKKSETQQKTINQREATPLESNNLIRAKTLIDLNSKENENSISNKKGRKKKQKRKPLPKINLESTKTNKEAGVSIRKDLDKVSQCFTKVIETLSDMQKQENDEADENNNIPECENSESVLIVNNDKKTSLRPHKTTTKNKIDSVDSIAEGDLHNLVDQEWALQGSVFVVNDERFGKQRIVRRSMRSVCTPSKPNLPFADEESNDVIDFVKPVKSKKKGKRRKSRAKKFQKIKFSDIVCADSSNESLYNPKLTSTTDETGEILVPKSLIEKSNCDRNLESEISCTSSLDELPDPAITVSHKTQFVGTSDLSSTGGREKLVDSLENTEKTIQVRELDKKETNSGKKTKTNKKKEASKIFENSKDDKKEMVERKVDLFKTSYMDKVIQEQERILQIIKQKVLLNQTQSDMVKNYPTKNNVEEKLEHRRTDENNNDYLQDQKHVVKTETSGSCSENSLLHRDGCLDTVVQENSTEDSTLDSAVIQNASLKSESHDNIEQAQIELEYESQQKGNNQEWDENQNVIYIISEDSNEDVPVIFIESDQVGCLSDVSQESVQIGDRNFFDWFQSELCGGNSTESSTSLTIEDKKNGIGERRDLLFMTEPQHSGEPGKTYFQNENLPDCQIWNDIEDRNHCLVDCQSCPIVDQEIVISQSSSKSSGVSHQEVYGVNLDCYNDEFEQGTVLVNDNGEFVLKLENDTHIHDSNYTNTKPCYHGYVLKTGSNETCSSDLTVCTIGEESNSSRVTVPAINEESNLSSETDPAVEESSSSIVTVAAIGGSETTLGTDNNSCKTSVRSDSNFTLSSIDSAELLNSCPESTTDVTVGIDQFNEDSIVTDCFGIRHIPEYEDSGETYSGLIFHDKLSIPYVVVNGYKYTLVKDVLPLFSKGCQPKCQIPRNVLRRFPGIHRTFCTWEQVYILDQLCSSYPRAIQTGEMLLRFDMVVPKMADIKNTIRDKHRNTKLKNSQNCL